MCGCQRAVLVGLESAGLRGDLDHAQPSVRDTRVHDVSL